MIILVVLALAVVIVNWFIWHAHRDCGYFHSYGGMERGLWFCIPACISLLVVGTDHNGWVHVSVRKV